MTKILLLDDRDSELFALLLNEAGVETVGVSSAKDALKWLEKNDADVILTDLAMPYLDGLSFIEQLDATKYHIGVLTGHSVESVATMILKDAGVEKIFLKNQDIKILVKKIVDWVTGKNNGSK